MDSIAVWWADPIALGARHGRTLARLLDASEVATAERYRYPADRNAYVVAHAMLRLALSSCASASPAAWRFERTATGRPHTASGSGLPDLPFSLSHTRSAVACAVAPDGSPGIDVQDITSDAPDPALLAYAFSARECAVLRGADATRAPMLFTHFWTMKEAVAKACGAGLAIDFGQIECALEPARIVGMPPGAPAPSRWQIDIVTAEVPAVLTLARLRSEMQPAPALVLHELTDERARELLRDGVVA